MKTHIQIAEALAIYRELDEVDRFEVDQHVAACESCAARLAAFQSIDRKLARLTAPRPDERLREEFYAAVGISSHRQRASIGIRQKLVRLSALADRGLELALAAILIAFLGFIIQGWPQSSELGKVIRPTPQAVSSRLDIREASPPSSPLAAGVTSDEQLTEANLARGGNATDSVGLNERIPDSPIHPLELAASDSAEGSAGFSSTTAWFVQTGDAGRVYFVQLDDNLWKLAEKYLGDGSRFDEIIQATHAKRAEDPSFAFIESPDRISPGSKLWIPATGTSLSVAEAVEKPTPTVASSSIAAGPSGHIAFGFWNNHPSRCTYEINVIDVAACLSSPETCQATRRIFPLNNVSEPALSPSGERLAFRGWGEPPSEESPYLNCASPVKVRYLANTTLNGTNLQGTGGFWEDSHPDWSSDGQQILFDSGRNGDGVIRILLINADGSDERDLYIRGQQPSWAPDSQRFVYRGCDLTGNRCGLWLAYAAPVKSWEAGTNMIGPVVEDGAAAHPDWSPASGQIVYQSPVSGSWDLYLVNSDGTGVQKLMAEPEIEGLPSWSPDGQWIAYLSNAGGNWGIWIIRADGSGRHLLFPFDGGIFTPQAVAPYGQRDWIDEQISWSW